MNTLTIAYTTEGTTDERFLDKIIERTFEKLLAETSIAIFPPIYINVKGKSIEKIFEAAQRAYGYDILCIHADADDKNDEKAFAERISPAFEKIEKAPEALCKNLVAIVPVYEIESWMLVDSQAFINEIGATMNEKELGFPKKAKQIESQKQPKQIIIKAIQIAYQRYPKRRNRPKIEQLYTPLSQKISLLELEKLPSYLKFQRAARQALVKLNFLKG